MSIAAAHLSRLTTCDRTLYGRACAIVRHAADAWGCSVDALIEPGRSPDIDSVRAALTVVIREQTSLSLNDIALVLNREDHSSIAHRIRTARAALFRRIEPVFGAYWSLIAYLRGRFILQGNAAIAEHPFEAEATIDLSAYITRPAGTATARSIREGVAEALGVDLAELVSTSSRSRPNTDARAVAFFLMRVRLGFSYPQIAQAMSVSTHSSVFTAAHRLADRIDAGDDELRCKLARCAEAVGIELPDSPLAAMLQRVSSPSAAPDASAGPRTGTAAPTQSAAPEDRTGLEGVSTLRKTTSPHASIPSESAVEAL